MPSKLRVPFQIATLIATLIAALHTSAAPFPSVDPANVGIQPEALEILEAHVQRLVDEERIVGGELLVIKDRQTVLQTAFGWKDREANESLDTDAVYCVRSMTKPFVGTAIQILIDEGKLSPETLVSEVLPSFAGEETGKVTIEHLLTHTSGLPFTTFKRPLADYADLADVAAEAAAGGLDFEPGAEFQYSDAGSDALGAIVAAITGRPVEEFIEQRILEPLDMRDTVTLLAENPAVQARVPSAYSGGTGAWTRHWASSDRPIFPIFLTSQSLYATTRDYARFLAWWMDETRLDGEQVLSSRTVRRALQPNRRIEEYPGSFQDLETYYAQQWMVFATESDAGSPRGIAFGHGGSDGTHAWAWPELDLMVLFFTQSRGTLAGVQLERHLQTLLVEGDLTQEVVPPTRPIESGIEQYAGFYWDEDVAHAYYVVTPRGDRLELDRPGRMHMVFLPSETPGRFLAEANPHVWIEFVRAEDGQVPAMKTFFGKREETDPRHTPAAGLPSADEVLELVAKAHRIDRLTETGGIRLAGTLDLVDRGMKGKISIEFDALRTRTALDFGPAQETIRIDGDRVWSASTGSEEKELEGRLRQQERLGQWKVLLGNWSEYYDEVEVLKRVDFGEMPLLMVRVIPVEGPGATIYIDEATGRVIRKDDLTQIPGLGIVGTQVMFEDYRDVDGVLLPFSITRMFASKMLGKMIATFDEVEVGTQLANADGNR